jgi:hypothetical protein
MISSDSTRVEVRPRGLSSGTVLNLRLLPHERLSVRYPTDGSALSPCAPISAATSHSDVRLSIYSLDARHVILWGVRR